VRVNATHPFVGDLRVRLTHVNTGTVVTLIDQPGAPASPNGCAGADIRAILDDEASAAVEGVCDTSLQTIDGRFLPQQPLSAFNGQNLAGTWTLNVADLATLDQGTLDSWCLEVNQHAPVVTSFTCNGGDLCDLDLGESFTAAFSFTDVEGNASSWHILLQRLSDGAFFESGQEPITPPAAAGTVPLNGGAFTCAQGGCPEVEFNLILRVSDTTGIESAARSVGILVHAAP
jgi:subtilisin-like proprotein convertase family protein